MILGPEVMAFTTVYVDNVCIASISFEEHINNLRKIEGV